jgi:O-antigen/teichoic acid export membrane protein
VATYHRIDQQFLLMWKGSDELGQYAAAVRLAEMLSLVPAFFMRSAFPAISAAAASAGTVPLEISRTCYRYLLLITLPPVILGVLFAPQIIFLLYGDAYSNASLALPWLMLAEIPVVAGIVYGHFSMAARLQRYDVLFTSIVATANIGLCIWLIPASGLTGAAIASLASYSLGIPVQLAFRATRSYSTILIRETLRVSLVGLLTWATFLLAGMFLPIPVSMTLAALVCLASAVLVRLIRKDDLRVVAGLVFP